MNSDQVSTVSLGPAPDLCRTLPPGDKVGGLHGLLLPTGVTQDWVPSAFLPAQCLQAKWLMMSVQSA